MKKSRIDIHHLHLLYGTMRISRIIIYNFNYEDENDVVDNDDDDYEGSDDNESGIYRFLLLFAAH